MLDFDAIFIVEALMKMNVINVLIIKLLILLWKIIVFGNMNFFLMLISNYHPMFVVLLSKLKCGQ